MTKLPKKIERLLDREELLRLEKAYGAFPREDFSVEMTASCLKFYRRAFSDRRGEILFVLQRPDGQVLLHTKKEYPSDLYRLPGGGIDWGEQAAESLGREIHEETGFTLKKNRFLGILTYEFTAPDEKSVPFVSYVFLVPTEETDPSPIDKSEGISGFRWIPTCELGEIAETLRTLPDDAPGRNAWGRFRAIGHDFVAERV